MKIGDLNVVFKKSTKKSNTLPPIILVHGSWHGAWCWETHFIDYLAQQGFDVYAPDLRGHGASPAGKALHWVRANDYVEDVLSVVDKLDRPPVLVGHSLGGFVVQHCMRKSDKLAGAGLLCTVPHYGTFPVTMSVASRRPIDFLKVNLTWSLYPLVKDPFKAKHMFLEDNVPDEEVIAFGKKLVDEAYWGYLDSMIFNLPGKYDGDLPMIIVGGEKDTLFPPKSQQATAKRYSASCHIVNGAPHDLMLSSQWREAADHFATWIKQLK